MSRDKPFRFLAAWVLHDQFGKFVENQWNFRSDWNETVTVFTNACKTWNKQVFGFTHERIRKLMRRLEGINRTEARSGLTQDLRHLQKELWNELEMTLT